VGPPDLIGSDDTRPDPHAAVGLGERPGDLEPAEDREHPDVVDDLVDDLVETVLAKGGRAVFVDDGILARDGRVAAVLRY